METQYTFIVSAIIWITTIIFLSGGYLFLVKDTSARNKENGKKIDQLAEKMGDKLDDIQHEIGGLKGQGSMMLEMIKQIDHRTTTLERERRLA